MNHRHTQHHMTEAIKNAIALEDHLTKDPCPECSAKHVLALENYLEEEYHTNPNADRRLLQLAQKVRDIRRELMEMQGLKHNHSSNVLSNSV